jgi:hypothetical protein
LYCSKCGTKTQDSGSFCQSCGFALAAGTSTHLTTTTAAEISGQPKNAGQGFAITGIVLGSLAIFFALFDFALIGSGEYDYILPEEIGFLFIASVTGLVFAILALSKKNKLGTLATVLCGSATFLTVLLSTFSA